MPTISFHLRCAAYCFEHRWPVIGRQHLGRALALANRYGDKARRAAILRALSLASRI